MIGFNFVYLYLDKWFGKHRESTSAGREERVTQSSAYELSGPSQATYAEVLQATQREPTSELTANGDG